MDDNDYDVTMKASEINHLLDVLVDYERDYPGDTMTRYSHAQWDAITDASIKTSPYRTTGFDFKDAGASMQARIAMQEAMDRKD